MCSRDVDGSATAARATWPRESRSSRRRRASKQHIPTGEGLLAFTTTEEAADALERWSGTMTSTAAGRGRSPRNTLTRIECSPACWNAYEEHS